MRREHGCAAAYEACALAIASERGSLAENAEWRSGIRPTASSFDTSARRSGQTSQKSVGQGCTRDIEPRPAALPRLTESSAESGYICSTVGWPLMGSRAATECAFHGQNPSWRVTAPTSAGASAVTHRRHATSRILGSRARALTNPRFVTAHTGHSPRGGKFFEFSQLRWRRAQ